MKLVYLGLGSNIGEREKNIEAALARIERPNLHLLRVSSLYETEPIGLREQRWFLNAVAEYETELFPLQLLSHLQRIKSDPSAFVRPSDYSGMPLNLSSFGLGK